MKDHERKAIEEAERIVRNARRKDFRFYGLLVLMIVSSLLFMLYAIRTH